MPLSRKTKKFRSSERFIFCNDKKQILSYSTVSASIMRKYQTVNCRLVLSAAVSFFLCFQFCTAEGVTKNAMLSFFRDMSRNGTVLENAVRPAPQWSPWGRNARKLKTSCGNDGTFSLSYTGSDDFSVTFDDRITAADCTVYVLYAEILVTKGKAGPSFVVRNTDGEVMDWNSGYREVTSADGWQSVCAAVTVAGGSERNLAASYMPGLKDYTVGTVEPRLAGNGVTEIRIRNAEIMKFGMNRPAAEKTVFGNSMLSVAVDSSDMTFSVKDARTGRTFHVLPGDLHGSVSGKCIRTEEGAVITAYDPADFRVIHVSYSLSGDTLSVMLSDDGNVLCGGDAMSFPYEFPGPVSVSAKEYLVLPVNEGISFYGDDADMLTGDYYAQYGHGMSMPFFGATDGESGWMCILDSPDDGGMRLARRNGLNCASPVWTGQKGCFGYARKCRYVFLDKGGYVAIAKRYRTAAEANGTLVTFEQKKKSRGPDGAARIEKLRGAVNFWTWTDPDASFCRQVHDAGITRILWSAAASPADIDAMNAVDGVLTGRYDIYQDVMDPVNFPKISYVSGDWVTEAFPDDIARDASGNMVQAWPIETKKDPKKFINCVSLCDMTAPSYARKRIKADLSAHAYGARFLDTTTASELRECWNPAHPMTRTQSRRARIELLGIISNEHHLVCGSETGADYAVPVCDYFEGMMSLGPYRVDDAGRNCDRIVTDVPERVVKFQLGEKYRLPLWELVYHDCTVSMWYWGDFSNKMPSLWAKRDMFNALYAVPPMFFTNKNDFERQKKRFVQSYNASESVTYAAFGAEMINHVFLTPDREVQMTEFANGVKVIVNFGKKDFVLNGRIIAAGSIVAEGTEGK
jgi:hypothetical protein